MQLPNPFANSSSVKPESSFSRTSIAPLNSNLINPGPGLPHAPNVTYKNFSLGGINGKNEHPRSKAYGFNNPTHYRSHSGSQYLPFSCDRCDRSFKTQDQLNIHISEHILCGIDGCQFVAHPKIVQKHIQMQHETGLASKIMKLNSPEEIQKWREERKRNFPSVANVARKELELKEKRERGEILEPSPNTGKFRNKRNNKRGRSGQTLMKSANSTMINQPKVLIQKEKLSPTPQQATTLPKTTPKVLSDGEIDSESETSSTVEVKVQATSGGALASLMGTYASDSEADEEVPEAKRPSTDRTNMSTSPEKEAKGIPGLPAEEKVERGRARQSKNRGRGKSPSKRSIHKAKLVPPKRLTLLQKLLQGEIVHERNVILQCVHYIVQQNFFGIGQTTGSD